MQASDTSDSFQKAVLERLDRLSTDVDKLTTDVDKLTTDVDKLATDVDKLNQELSQTNVRVDAYQKASNQVVNLAFGLIATATLTILISTVLSFLRSS
jgi:outer membrane murein-binding lipoprotein Lpp